MKKRVVSALLAAFLCISLLAACGSKDNKSSETTTTAAKAEVKEITAIKGVKFTVPETWKGIGDKESSAIFTAGDGVTVTITNMENDESNKKLFDTYLAMAKSQGDQSSSDAQIITVDGKEGIRANSAVTEAFTSYVLIPNGEKLFSIIVIGKIEHKDAINKDVLDVINSLKFI